MSERFKIEGKSFEIKTVRNRICIDERRRGFQSVISFHSDLGSWVVRRIRDIVRRGEKLGYAGSKRRGEECLILNVKSNAKGVFLSMLSCNDAGKGRMKAIYCPFSYKSKGLLLLADTIEDILRIVDEDKKEDCIVDIKDSDSVVIQHGFDKRVQELRYGSFFLETKDNGISWGELLEETKRVLGLKKPPKMVEISEFKAFCEIGEGDSLDILDKIGSFDWFDYSILIKRWSPGKETIPPQWMQTKQSWVLIQGVPFHLWSDKVFSKLCKPFGKFIKVDESPCEFMGLTALKILVDDCKIGNIPNFSSVIDQGTKYSVRLIPILMDELEKEEELHLETEQSRVLFQRECGEDDTFIEDRGLPRSPDEGGSRVSLNEYGAAEYISKDRNGFSTVLGEKVVENSNFESCGALLTVSGCGAATPPVWGPENLSILAPPSASGNVFELAEGGDEHVPISDGFVTRLMLEPDPRGFDDQNGQIDSCESGMVGCLFDSWNISPVEKETQRAQEHVNHVVKAGGDSDIRDGLEPPKVLEVGLEKEMEEEVSKDNLSKAVVEDSFEVVEALKGCGFGTVFGLEDSESDYETEEREDGDQFMNTSKGATQIDETQNMDIENFVLPLAISLGMKITNDKEKASAIRILSGINDNISRGQPIERAGKGRWKNKKLGESSGSEDF